MTEEKKKSVMSVVIYGVVLLATAAVLVTASLIINVRSTKHLKNEMNETQQGAARVQTTLINVQEENETLRGMLEDANNRIAELKKQNEEMTTAAEQDTERINSLSAISKAGMHILNRRFSRAREQLELVNTEVLEEDELAAYKRLCGRVY